MCERWLERPRQAALSAWYDDARVSRRDKASVGAPARDGVGEGDGAAKTTCGGYAKCPGDEERLGVRTGDVVVEEHESRELRGLVALELGEDVGEHGILHRHAEHADPKQALGPPVDEPVVQPGHRVGAGVVVAADEALRHALGHLEDFEARGVDQVLPRSPRVPPFPPALGRRRAEGVEEQLERRRHRIGRSVHAGLPLAALRPVSNVFADHTAVAGPDCSVAGTLVGAILLRPGYGADAAGVGTLQE